MNEMNEMTNEELIARLREIAGSAIMTPAGQATVLEAADRLAAANEKIERLNAKIEIDVTLNTLEYYCAEAENGWCKIPRRVVADAVAALAARQQRIAELEAQLAGELDELLARLWPNRNFGPQSVDEIAVFIEEERSAAEARLALASAALQTEGKKEVKE